MKEIEIKLKYSNEKSLRERLSKVGAKPTQTYEIIDVYYAKEGETMKTAESLLRIRTKKGVSEITYKGKRETDSNVWERVEINVPVGDPEKMELILKNLGLVRILRNRTLREYWDVHGTELGIMKIIEPAKVEFVEIEGKTKEDVEKVTNLFRGILEPLGKDYFQKLDKANDDRNNLPFRKNCEGYFINSEGKILAKDSGKGFIMFPGGGVDESEEVTKAMIRETKEETGAVLSDIKKASVLKIVWGLDWAKTEKQKKRYEQFQGDEMHFFTGFATEGESDREEEDAWIGEKFMSLHAVINFIEKSRPFEESVMEYRELQLNILRSIQKKLGQNR